MGQARNANNGIVWNSHILYRFFHALIIWWCILRVLYGCILNENHPNKPGIRLEGQSSCDRFWPHTSMVAHFFADDLVLLAAAFREQFVFEIQKRRRLLLQHQRYTEAFSTATSRMLNWHVYSIHYGSKCILKFAVPSYATKRHLWHHLRVTSAAALKLKKNHQQRYSCSKPARIRLKILGGVNF